MKKEDKNTDSNWNYSIASSVMDKRKNDNLKVNTSRLLGLLGGRTIHPDFCCLKISSRKEIIYEHFGMMDSPEYVANVMLKLNTYEAAGLKMGEDYIFTMESASMPLSTRAVERIVDKYLL